MNNKYGSTPKYISDYHLTIKMENLQSQYQEKDFGGNQILLK
jgi:hypothetical protein